MTRVTLNTLQSIRTQWTNVHNVISQLAIGGLFLFFIISFEPAKKLGLSLSVFILLYLLLVVVVLYLAVLYMLSYMKRREAELRSHRENMSSEKADTHMFKGSLWYVKLDGDDVEVVSRVPYTQRQRGKLSEIKQLWVMPGNNNGAIFLCFHDSKLRQPKKEIGINTDVFQFPVLLEMMRTFEVRAINAQASPQYIETMQTGKGIS